MTSVAAIHLTRKIAAHIDQPARRALLAENGRRLEKGLSPVDVAPESVTILRGCGPETTVKLARYNVHTIGEFAAFDQKLVPTAMLGAYAALRG